MDFRIADTFTDSLARLTGEEQKAVKTTAFDLQVNPTATGMNLHQVKKSKDKNFWSMRASSDFQKLIFVLKVSCEYGVGIITKSDDCRIYATQIIEIFLKYIRISLFKFFIESKICHHLSRLFFVEVFNDVGHISTP